MEVVVGVATVVDGDELGVDVVDDVVDEVDEEVDDEVDVELDEVEVTSTVVDVASSAPEAERSTVDEEHETSTRAVTTTSAAALTRIAERVAQVTAGHYPRGSTAWTRPDAPPAPCRAPVLVAESEGFEPSVTRRPQRLSRPPHSSALATLRAGH